MSEKKEKEKPFIFPPSSIPIIFFIIVIPLSIILYVLISGLVENNEYTDYQYELFINPINKNESYIVKVPILVPLSERDQIDKFENKLLSNLEIKKGAIDNYFINTTEKGEALEITCKGEVEIKIEFSARYDNHKSYIFSTREINRGFSSYDGNHWLYYEGMDENITIDITYKWGDYDFGSEGTIKEELSSIGWQLIEGEEDHWITN
jgi:hypothetical protein